MKKLIIFFSLVFVLPLTNASDVNVIEKSITKLNWEGIDVVYIEDNRFPTYDLTIYFADGALSDEKGQMGLTDHAFNFLDSGTAKLSQREILEQLEFYGTEFSADVTHEYTTVSASGLSKDLKTSMIQLCSLFRETIYPEAVIKKELSVEKANLEGLITSPQGLAERVFREYSLSGTPYSYPVSGKIADHKNYKSDLLRKKMDYFLNTVKKRIYLTGPKSILEVEKILKNDCGFKGQEAQFVRSIDQSKIKKGKPQFVFVPVPDANQVQLRIGRYLGNQEINQRVLDTLTSDFLGGGFTSRLMREVRGKRGLTYSIGSYVSAQKQYGRAGISTFTKNETIDRLIEVIDETIQKVEKEGITQSDLSNATDGLVGAYPFKFENNRAFLGQLLLLDHIEEPYSSLFDFRERVQQYKGADVSKRLTEVFGMKNQIIFVLGDRKILSKLQPLTKKYGPLKIVNYKKYL